MIGDELIKIPIKLPQADIAYEVIIGSSVRSDTDGQSWLCNIGKMVHKLVPGKRAVIVCDSVIIEGIGQVVIDSMQGAGYEVLICEILANEKNKTLSTVHGLYDNFIRGQIERGCPVIAVGGGVTGDVAGFAAATYMRGLPFVNVPTTLLSMVDASVGGKTGVNLELVGGVDSDKDNIDNANESFLYKNIVGAFHQPRLVFIDVGTLNSLPPRHFRAGLAECVKHGLLGDRELFEWMLEHAAELKSPDFTQTSDKDRDWLITFVERNVRIKADIVQRDEKESGIRMLLNLGHTFAHVIETRPELDLLHGEAVGLGLIVACAAGIVMGITNSQVLDQTTKLLKDLGLPIEIDGLPEDIILLRAMRKDKKVKTGQVKLIIPVDIGRVEIINSVSEKAIVAGWHYIRR